MASKTFKGYLLTVLCGFVVLAAVLFVILQWGVYSTFSLYGKPIEQVPTIWVVLGAAVGGPIFLVVCRLLFRGVWILYTARRDEARRDRQVGAEAGQASAGQAPAGQAGEAAPSEPS